MKKLIHHIRVSKDQVMVLMLDILKSNESDSWFSTIHFQEVLGLLQENILLTLYVNSTDYKSDIHSYHPKIITGERVTVKFYFRKHCVKQWCLVPELTNNCNDFSIKNYKEYQFAKAKIIACVCSSSSYNSVGVSEIFKNLSGASNDQALISNYFPKSISTFQQTSRQKETLREIMRRKPNIDKQKKSVKSNPFLANKGKLLKQQRKSVFSNRKDTPQRISPTLRNFVQKLESIKDCSQRDIENKANIDEFIVNEKIGKNEPVSKSGLSQSSLASPFSSNRKSRDFMTDKEIISKKDQLDYSKSNKSKTLNSHLNKSKKKNSEKCSTLKYNIIEKETLDLFQSETHHETIDSSVLKTSNLFEGNAMAKTLKAKSNISKSCKRRSIDSLKDLENSTSSVEIISSSKRILKNDLKTNKNVKIMESTAKARKSASYHSYKSLSSSSDTNDEWDDFKKITIGKKPKRKKEKLENTGHLIDSNIEHPLIKTENIRDNNLFQTLQTLTPIQQRRLHMKIKKVDKVSSLSEIQIKYLVITNEAYLRNIYEGKFYCRRHKDYKGGGRARADLTYQVHLTLFTPDQHTWVMDTLVYLFCQQNPKYVDYCLKVLFPEILVKIHMERFSNSHDDTEKIMIQHITMP